MRKRSESMKALRVLVVEDEILIGMLLADALGAMGYEVCAIEPTETGAVAAAARCNPDLMIVDARLRDGSGVSAVEEILRAGWVPHVFISGETSTILFVIWTSFAPFNAHSMPQPPLKPR